MSKDIKRIFKAAKREGATIREGKKHHQVLCPAGGLVTVSRTASDRRALQNVVADLRRHGLVLAGE